MPKQDKSFEEHWEYWRNRDVLRNVPDICETSAKTMSKNKRVETDKKIKKELTIPERDALAKTFPFHEFMNEIEYEGLCEVDGLLPDKLAQNGTTLGDITTAMEKIEIEEVTSKLRVGEGGPQEK
ncbi:hypothetical protein GQ55_4G226200 [Panicum hallii var. hallii]|uniref:Uncharacterized protein n=1 Tax=Panicum hallii var. hallii TaxID=1504633 RepID=A0A2T7DZE9_9POAL|nr:hypothetical protein GQ55_4G226200 [Panicum hallii var. hallii]